MRVSERERICFRVYFLEHFFVCKKKLCFAFKKKLKKYFTFFLVNFPLTNRKLQSILPATLLYGFNLMNTLTFFVLFLFFFNLDKLLQIKN